MVRRVNRAVPAAADVLADEIRNLMREAGAGAAVELKRLAGDAKSESVRLAAIKELLDRGFGRAAAAPSDNAGGAIAHLLVDDGYAD